MHPTLQRGAAIIIPVAIGQVITIIKEAVVIIIIITGTTIIKLSNTKW
jgi:hypothetical protein